MFIADHLVKEFGEGAYAAAPLTEHAWNVLRAIRMRTGMSALDVIETALKGYLRAWKESE